MMGLLSDFRRSFRNLLYNGSRTLVTVFTVFERHSKPGKWNWLVLAGRSLTM